MMNDLVDAVLPLEFHRVSEEESLASEWQTISILNEKYRDTSVSLTNSDFHGDTWDFSQAAMDTLVVYFKSVVPQDKPSDPLELMVRLVGYYLCRGHGRVEYAALTAGHLLRYTNRLAHWLADQNILIGHPGDYLKPASALTADDFRPFLKSISQHSITLFHNHVRFLNGWYHLSLAGKLPTFMALTCDPFDNASIDETYHELKSTHDESDDSGWSPIPLKYAFHMTKEALVYTEDKRDEVLRVYEVFMQSYDVAPERPSFDHYTKPAINFPFKVRGTGFPILKSTRPELFEDLPAELYNDKGVLSAHLMRQYLQRAQASAMIIIMITTGLRNWEVRDLKVGCTKPDSAIPNAYRLNAKIKKTARLKTRGKVVSLPIPHSTELAVSLLESMRFHTSESDTQYLLIPTKNIEYTKDDNRVSVDTLTSRLSYFCEYTEVGYIPHPHQFRKTIAGYFGLNSKLALLMIMRLFSHDSAEMSARYLRNNPLISAARQQLLLEATEEMLDPITEGLQMGKIAGPMAKQIQERIAAQNGSNSLTSEELCQTLSELLRERAEAGHIHVQATPLAVCVYNVEATEKPPCAKFGSPCSQGLCDAEVQLQKLAGNTPNINRCIGLGCKRALAVPLNKANITETLEHYREVLENAEYTDNIQLVDEARNFIEIHEPALETIS